MAILAYLRVSTDEQAQSGLGLDAQLDAITKTIGEPDGVFVDRGISGSNANRPELLKALDALQAGDVLAVAKRDRLARDVFLSLWIEKEAKKRQARIVSAAGEGTESDDPSAVLMRTIVDAFAEYERSMIGVRTTAALAQKKARGERAGEIPFGANLAADRQHLQTNAAEVKAIEIMHELRRRGYSLRAICAELEARNVKTKKGNTNWQAKTVARILNRAA